MFMHMKRLFTAKKNPKHFSTLFKKSLFIYFLTIKYYSMFDNKY